MYPPFELAILKLVRAAKRLAELFRRPLSRRPLASQHRRGDLMSQSRKIWFEIIDTTSLEGRSVAVPVPDEGPAQWRVGTLHSGAELDIDEPQLDGTQLFVLGASNHLILRIIVGGAALPAFGVGQREATGEWHWEDPMQWPLTTLKDNQFSIRFDYRWLKIGRYALRASWKPIPAGGGTKA